jgi:Flp pilus assembly protein TadG
MLANAALRFRQDSSGASAVEFAIVGALFIFLSLGVLEFGRALLVRNSLADAADVATRTALLDRSASNTKIEASARAAFDENKTLLRVAFAAESSGGVNFRVVTLSYPITLLVPALSSSPLTLSVTRRIRA